MENRISCNTDYLVVFTKSNAHVLKNCEEINKFKSYPNSFLNPSLSLVQNINTKFWRIENNKIVPMSDKEKYKRLKNASSTQDDIRPMYRYTLLRYKSYLNYLSYLCTVLLLLATFKHLIIR